MTQDKPVVHYTGKPNFYRIQLSPDLWETYKEYLDEEGCYERAKVYGLDHPFLGEDEISTSIIVKKNEDGSFETLNTLYVPAKEKHEQS